MTIPKVPPSAVKLFSRKRSRRQVVVDPSETKKELQETVQEDKILVEIPASPVESAPVAVTLVDSPPPGALRRRG